VTDHLALISDLGSLFPEIGILHVAMLCQILDTHGVLSSGRRRITTRCNALSLSIASAMRFRSLGFDTCEKRYRGAASSRAANEKYRGEGRSLGVFGEWAMWPTLLALSLRAMSGRPSCHAMVRGCSLNAVDLSSRGAIPSRSKRRCCVSPEKRRKPCTQATLASASPVPE
jgi:hypothetical protein